MAVVPAIGKATGSATFEYNDGAIDDVTPASGSTAGMCCYNTIDLLRECKHFNILNFFI